MITIRTMVPIPMNTGFLRGIARRLWGQSWVGLLGGHGAGLG
jgi:hypothetical protein